MRPTRKPKVSASSVIGEVPDSDSECSASSHDDDEEDEMPRASKVPKVDTQQQRTEGHNENIRHDMTREECEEKVAFCCYQCFCCDEIKDQVPPDDAFVLSGDNGLYHRRCCHDLTEQPMDDWCCQFEAADFEAGEAMMNGAMPAVRATAVEIPRQKWKRFLGNYFAAKKHESQIYNDDSLPDPTHVLLTNVDYMENQKNFMKLDPKQSGAVVLDMFAGIGSGIVVLKRLGIKMQTIVHVEHDPVATHVYKWNHDHRYNEKLPNEGIEHIYIEKFETFMDRGYLDQFLKKYGPIDIILGGPPCVDYSKANARRQGTEGTQGSLMLDFGDLVRRIERRQEQAVFFLAENVKLENAKNVPLVTGDLERIKSAFGVSWCVDLDAALCSPGRRLRTFLSNFPVHSQKADYIVEENSVCCIQDGYNLFGKLVEENMTLKANCFMAHKTRLDDSPRMDIFKIECGPDGIGEKFLCRSFNVQEREHIMGFPLGYVEEAVNELFDQLFQNGYSCVLTTVKYWKETLPEKYHHFGGRKNFAFGTDTFPLELRLSPPPKNPNEKCVFYNNEEYAKRLIGNAFSIPVVEIMLRELQSKFPSQRYAQYDYPFVWQPSKEPVHEASSLQEVPSMTSSAPINPPL